MLQLPILHEVEEVGASAEFLVYDLADGSFPEALIHSLFTFSIFCDFFPFHTLFDHFPGSSNLLTVLFLDSPFLLSPYVFSQCFPTAEGCIDE